MAVRHILIVDDQRDAREMFRSSLETLDHKVKITEVPSAEEALLLINRSPVDLVVSDIRLPGMSGFDLQRRLVRLAPETKVILVTGLIDTETRRRMAEIDIEAYFFKPVEIADFLDVVERCLGIIDTGPLPPPADEFGDAPQVNLSDSLASLRKDLKAISVALLDESGHVMARAGDWPDSEMEDLLIPALMGALSTGEKVANLLGRRPPDDLYYFEGMVFDLFAAHVGPSASLMVICDARENDRAEQVLQMMRPAVRDLFGLLMRLGVGTGPQRAEESLDFELIEVVEEEEEEAPALHEIFPQLEQIDFQDADAFWDTALEKSDGTISSSDALSYEQARQLGLAPEDDISTTGD